MKDHPAFEGGGGPGFRYFEEDREEVHLLSIDRAGKEAMVTRFAWRTDRMNDGRAAGRPAKPR